MTEGIEGGIPQTRENAGRELPSLYERQILMERRAKRQKNSLINQKNLTPQLQRLLTHIDTETLSGKESASLIKVKAVLYLRDKLSACFSSQQPIVYLGSGVDWQFPVALGADIIDMIDRGFKDCRRIEEIIKSVREFDPQATLTNGEIPIINFCIDLGAGLSRTISIRLINSDVAEYEPDSEFAGVLEILGPSKHILDETSPVLPNIARKLKHDGFILNFDFDSRRFKSRAVDKRQERNVGYLIVADRDELVKIAEQSYQKKQNSWSKIPLPQTQSTGSA